VQTRQKKHTDLNHEPWREEILHFSFFQIMAIENLKNLLILAFLFL
jgi:hypothetical protein